MLQTTYKTKYPEHLERIERPEDFANAEYRQVSLRASGGREVLGKFVVRVNHGWWNDAEKLPIHAIQQFEEECDSWDAASVVYEEQLKHFIQDGFVHSFSIDQESETGRRYEKLDTT